MSIVVGSETKLVVSGLTGREGSFHGLRNRAYGTDLVAGVTPGKGGQDVEGVPIFDSIAEAVEKQGANTSMIFVPARFAAPAIDEAIESGVETVIAITEGIPVLDMLKTYWKAKEAGVRLIGPNCPGVLSPGKANVGIIPAQFFDPGPIGVVSKSGTLTYQIGNELKQAGEGKSSIVGIGGDPIIGSDFIDVLTLYEADPETFVDYEEDPREYFLNAVTTILDVQTRVSDLYSRPFDQTQEQLRLLIEKVKERQEYELINNPEYGLLTNVASQQVITTRSGAPTPDDLDELISKVWKEPAFFLAHPRAIAAFGRECTRRGVPPPTVTLFGNPFLTWRGLPLVPSDKVPLTSALVRRSVLELARRA